MKISNLLA